MIKNRYLLICAIACYDSDTLVDFTVTGQKAVM